MTDVLVKTSPKSTPLNVSHPLTKIRLKILGLGCECISYLPCYQTPDKKGKFLRTLAPLGHGLSIPLFVYQLPFMLIMLCLHILLVLHII